MPPRAPLEAATGASPLGALISLAMCGALALVGGPAEQIFAGIAAIGLLYAAVVATNGRIVVDDESLTRWRWWGAQRRFPLAELRDLRRLGTVMVHVRFHRRREGVMLHLQRADHAAIYERLREKMGVRPPAALEVDARGRRTVLLPRLRGLSLDRCALCKSTRGVAGHPITAHAGFSVILFGLVVRAGFDLPTCRRHRWRRRVATGAMVVALAACFFAGVGLSVLPPEGDSLRDLGHVLLALTGVLVLVEENDAFKYVLDASLLGVRLGWLSTDGERSTLHVSSAAVEAVLTAHLRATEGAHAGASTAAPDGGSDVPADRIGDETGP